MNLEDREQQLPPPTQGGSLHHHHPRRKNPYQKRLETTASKPRAYVILLLVLAFALGYLSHSHPLLSSTASDVLEHNSFPAPCAEPLPPSDVRRTILSRVFNNTSPWQSFPPLHARPLLLKEWTKGWGSQMPVFEHLIEQVRPRTIVEVGTFLGASATHMASIAKKLGLETQIVCIDDFRGWPGYYDEEKKSLKMVNGDSLLLYQFMQNVARANATENIIMMPFSAGTALGGLCDWGVYGDLVEVDAAHDFHSAWVDINHAFKVLRPGGVLFGHDYAWDGVRKAVHIFARLHGFQVKLDGEHWILY
ncbi:hypothetical protein SASPL_147698 [Salvia splendens]|uniref:S-adenosyl-L-methionine-dependent methyltransferase n=1 Tax=Salvia splendens TaxID=180675 RepID=A0A8X8WEZ0_SALSN|nr:uncharacterized protein LOC121776202 [Salvia splendens]KAG6393456.1 hypothetical protein SASPL_147698 [Salvia splendens]